MSAGNAPVRVGQVLEIPAGDYRYRACFFCPENPPYPLRLRVLHVPESIPGLRPDWVSLLGVELTVRGEERQYRTVAVRTSALPGGGATSAGPDGPGDLR